MKKEPDSRDMPEEIDFSHGVRGKYADRYREGLSIREATPKDPVAFHETQSRLGKALWHAQGLEAAFVAYLSLVHEMAVPEAGVRVHQLLEHEMTQAQLKDLWQASPDVADYNAEALKDRFTRFIPERNWLVHRCSFELEKLVDSSRQGHDVAIRLEEFADEARYLSQYLIVLIETKLTTRGMKPDEIEKRRTQVIEDWAAA